MPRLHRTLRLSGAVLLAAGASGIGLAAADAATIPGAVTDVDIAQTSASLWSDLRLDLDWKVPDGVKAGDTFSLRLPAELRATDGMRFPLKDAAGVAVANAVVDGGTVTFTMTDYAETHVGVHGSAWFWVRFANGVEPTDQLSLVFQVDGRTFTDEIAVTDPGPGNPDYPSKWQAWKKDDSGKNYLLWAVDGPTVTPAMVGQTYQIVDDPGLGQDIDCDHIDVFIGTRGAGGFAQTGYYVTSLASAYDCTADRVAITIRPEAGDVGHAFRLLGRSTVTEDLPEYTNTGLVRLWGKVELPVKSVVKAGGGGVGTGETPTSTPTSPSPTTTSPEPTTTTTPVPTTTTSPAPTTTTSPEPTTTTPAPTTTSPAQPAPTPTVTVPGPTTTVIVVPGQPTVTVVPVPTVTVPASPVPTVTVTSTNTVTSSPTGSPTLAPGATPTSEETVTVTPTPTSPASPTPTVAPGTPTATVTTTTKPAPVTTVAGGTPVGGVVGPDNRTAPRRIDTGVPETVDPRVAGAGGVLAMAGGLALIGLSRRREQDS